MAPHQDVTTPSRPHICPPPSCLLSALRWQGGCRDREPEARVGNPPPPQGALPSGKAAPSGRCPTPLSAEQVLSKAPRSWIVRSRLLSARAHSKVTACSVWFRQGFHPTGTWLTQVSGLPGPRKTQTASGLTPKKLQQKLGLPWESSTLCRGSGGSP